jgi:hypothetical protein
MATRWTTTFKSRGGVTCLVKIYDPDFPSTTDPFDVKAAADPFSYDEGDSQDLLNDVMRYRTGYLRIIDDDTLGFKHIEDIYPQKPFDRYVEVYYDGALGFTGYIQVTDFDDEQVPQPRVLEFPVTSPLGLFDKKNFSNTTYRPPTMVTLGQLLTRALQSFDYERVYFPKNHGYPNPVNLGMQCFSTLVNPWNDDYHTSVSSQWAQKVMKGQPLSYLIESICHAFGWICHDTPTALIFTAFDYQGAYSYSPADHIYETGYIYDADDIPTTAVAVTDYLTPADDHANIQTIQPETGIEVDYEGDDGSIDFSFDRTYVARDQGTDGVVTMPSMSPSDGERWSVCDLMPVPQIGEFWNLGTISFDANDKVVGKGIVAWNGHVGILFSTGSQDEQICAIRQYVRKINNVSYDVKFDIMTSEYSIGVLKEPDDPETFKTIHIAKSITQTDDYVNVILTYHTGTTPLQSQYLIFIENIEFVRLVDSEPYASYREKPASASDVIDPNGSLEGNPTISASVTMPVSMYRKNDRLLGLQVRSSRLTTYPYLFTPRKELKARFRIDSALPWPYALMVTHLGKKWRVIAQQWEPWNDEMVLTLEHSSILSTL